MKKQAFILFLALVLWLSLACPNTCFSVIPIPIPDVKANGYDTPVCLVPQADLVLSLSLNSGGMTDPADWWLVLMSPTQMASPTAEGWQLASILHLRFSLGP